MSEQKPPGSRSTQVIVTSSCPQPCLLGRSTVGISKDMSAENKAHAAKPLQRILEEYAFSLRPGASGLFRRHHQKLKSNLKSTECNKTLAGHLSSRVHEVKWARPTKGKQQPPAIHTEKPTPGTLASNYFQVWEQTELRINTRDPTQLQPQKTTQAPGVLVTGREQHRLCGPPADTSPTHAPPTY